MTALSTKRVATHRPVSVTVVAAVLMLLGVTAVAGGTQLATGWWPGLEFPNEWLERLPLIDSWTVPGLVLGIGFGLGSLLTAYGVIRRPNWAIFGWVRRLTGFHWSWLATIIIGIGMAAWIALQLNYLPGQSWLHAVYGAVGVLLTLMPLTSSARLYLKVG